MVCYAEKQGKTFWSSSLGQMVQFDTIIFGTTFKNYFGQFVWIEKKSYYKSRVSRHEAPTKNWEILGFLSFSVPIGNLFQLENCNKLFEKVYWTGTISLVTLFIYPIHAV